MPRRRAASRMEETGRLGSKLMSGGPRRRNEPGRSPHPGSLAHQCCEDVRPRVHVVATPDAYAAPQGYINLGVARQPHVGAALSLPDALSIAHERLGTTEVARSSHEEDNVVVGRSAYPESALSREPRPRPEVVVQVQHLSGGRDARGVGPEVIDPDPDPHRLALDAGPVRGIDRDDAAVDGAQEG